MSNLLTITAGWTQELGPFVLRNNGTPIDLNGMTVELILKSTSTGQVVDTTGQVRLDNDLTSGKVYYTPEAGDFAGQRALDTFTAHWKLTDVAGDVIFIPNGEPDTMKVARP